MPTLVQVGLANAATAALLALAALAAGRWCRKPALVHSLWLLVLVKLITPPFFPVRRSGSPAPPPPPIPTAVAVAQRAPSPQPEDDAESNALGGFLENLEDEQEALTGLKEAAPER